MRCTNSQIGDRQSTALGILARLWWMFFGNLSLVFSAIFIFQKGGGFFQWADGFFWMALASLVLVRYVDIRFLDGCTATGGYASVKDWIRYAALLTACSAAVWMRAHVAGYLFAVRAVPR